MSKPPGDVIDRTTICIRPVHTQSLVNVTVTKLTDGVLIRADGATLYLTLLKCKHCYFMTYCLLISFLQVFAGQINKFNWPHVAPGPWFAHAWSIWSISVPSLPLWMGRQRDQFGVEERAGVWPEGPLDTDSVIVHSCHPPPPLLNPPTTTIAPSPPSHPHSVATLSSRASPPAPPPPPP